MYFLSKTLSNTTIFNFKIFHCQKLNHALGIILESPYDCLFQISLSVRKDFSRKYRFYCSITSKRCTWVLATAKNFRKFQEGMSIVSRSEDPI